MTVSQKYDKRSFLFYLQDGGAEREGDVCVWITNHDTRLEMTLILNKSSP